MINPYIRILAHADDPKFPVDYHRLILAAMEQHVILELNNNSLAPDGYRGNAKENSRQILTLCKKYHYPVLLSSDSHGHENIGNFQYALKLIEETNFPMELILNSSVTDFLSFLKK
ncbi:MAG: phosphatase, partial [Lachnospiraceae bacterium]|nr:phosphatase [Lachnospiraceae bacterium]